MVVVLLIIIVTNASLMDGRLMWMWMRMPFHLVQASDASICLSAPYTFLVCGSDHRYQYYNLLFVVHSKPSTIFSRFCL